MAEQNMTPLTPTAPQVEQPTMPTMPTFGAAEMQQEAKQFTQDLQDFTQKASDQELLDGMEAVFSELKGEPQAEAAPQTDTVSLDQPTSEVQQRILNNQKGAQKVREFGKGVVQDVTLGAMQAPRSAARGVVNAANETLDTTGIEQVVRGLKGLAKLPGIASDFVSGNLTPERKAELVKQLETPADTLPNLDKPEVKTVTGEVIETVSQFLAGFVLANKAMKTAGFVTKAGATRLDKILDSANRGALADVIAFDEQQERLSDLVQTVPALQNPVTEFLSTSGDDNMLVAKFKQSVEAAGFGALADSIVEGVRTLKAASAAKKSMEAAKPAAAPLEAVQPSVDPKSFSVLGDAANDSLVIRTAQTKLKTAAKETKGIKAADVTAKQVEDYKMQHRPPEANDGAPLFDLTSGELAYPKDIYSANAESLYRTGFKEADKESFSVIKSVKDNPEAQVTIYRAVPKNAGDEVNSGDWVTLSKAYAKQHGISHVNGDYKIISKKVSASELFTNADSINEFGYWPKQKDAISAKPYQINFARINGEEDIKAVMDNLVNEPSLTPSIDAARRGVQSQEATLTAAQDVNGFADLMKRRTGEAFNAEQIVAARQVYYDTTEKLMETAKLASRPEASDVDQFNFRRMLAIHQAVQKEFMGVRAEAGRALQAWRIDLAGGSRFAKQVEETLTEFGGSAVSKELAQKLAGAGRALTTDQINNVVQRSAFARTTAAVSEAWTLGLLTNPTTHIVNVGSNILTGMTLGAERLAQTVLPNSNTPIQEGVYYFAGFLGAQKEAFMNAAKAFKTGQVGFGLGKVEAPYQRATSKEVLLQTGNEGSVFRMFAGAMDWWGGLLSKYVGGSLAAGDEYGKTLLYRAQLHAMAAREGVSQGLDGKALKEFVADKVSAPDNITNTAAMDFADYGTYTKALSGLPANVQATVSRNPALRFVMPFIRTPMNIFKFAFERTPIAFAMKGFRDDISAGGVRADAAMAKLGTGMAVMAIATDFSMQGKITGAGPQDPETLAALKRTGWQPYSIKVGDKYVSYSRWEPFATLLGISADMSEITSNYESYDIAQQQEVEKLMLAAVAATANQVVGKTFMQGFADLVEMFSDPARYAATWGQRMAGSFVPAGVAAVERAISPELSYVTSEIAAIKSRIPGLSSTVPARLNVWGEEIKAFYPNEQDLATNVGERFLSLVNPVYYSKAKDEPVDTFMLKNGFEVDMPVNRQSFQAFGDMGSDSVMVDLKEYPEMYHRLVKLRGQEVTLAKYGDLNMKDFMNELFTDGSAYSTRFFGDFTGYDEQQQFIQRVVSDYTKEAKKRLVEEFPVIQQIVDDELQKRIILNQNRGAQ